MCGPQSGQSAVGAGERPVGAVTVPLVVGKRSSVTHVDVFVRSNGAAGVRRTGSIAIVGEIISTSSFVVRAPTALAGAS